MSLVLLALSISWPWPWSQVLGLGLGLEHKSLKTSLLLPEVVPEIDANPVSLLWRRELGFREFAKYGELSKFAASIGHQKLKGFQLGGLPRDPTGTPLPDPVIGSRSMRSP